MKKSENCHGCSLSPPPRLFVTPTPPLRPPRPLTPPFPPPGHLTPTHLPPSQKHDPENSFSSAFQCRPCLDWFKKVRKRPQWIID